MRNIKTGYARDEAGQAAVVGGRRDGLIAQAAMALTKSRRPRTIRVVRE
jgi:hypothetical protein